jgi:nucleoside phosphorylase
MPSPIDLVTELERRVLKLLADAHGPASGRAVAEALSVSPTTASRTLTRLEELGLVTHEEFGRTFNWRLNFQDPTIEAWLLGTGAFGHSVQATGTRPQMIVAVFTALFEEFEAIAEFVPFQDTAIVPPTRFSLGQFRGKDIDWTVYVAEIGMGNLAAATAVAAAATLLRPDLVLFVGVAGSVKAKDACRGDVVAPDSVVLLGPGKETKEGDTSVFRGRVQSLPTHNGIAQLARHVAHLDWTALLREARPDIVPKNDHDQRPRALIKPMAASLRVHADDTSDAISYLRAHMSDVVAIDMESGGVYEAAFKAEVPALSVRGISDHLSDKRPEDDEEWQPRAARHAASFAFTLLMEAKPRDVVPWSSSTTSDGPPTTSAISTQSMLLVLPPGVSIGFAWAERLQVEGVEKLVAQLYENREQPSKWLAKVDVDHPPAILAGEDSLPLWFMAAEFAGGYSHEDTDQLFEAAASHSPDQQLAALLLSRAALSAAALGREDRAHVLLDTARRAAPDVAAFWNVIDDGLSMQNVDVVVRTAAICVALGLPVKALANVSVNPAEGCAELAAHLARVSPEMLDATRFQAVLMFGNALRVEGRLAPAQYLYESLMNGELAPESPSAVWGLLVGPRSASCLLDLARTLIMRALSMTDVSNGLDVQSTLILASELALAAQARRREWKGPTGQTLAIAADAIARSGDPRRAIALLLPPPRGSATPSEATSKEVTEAAPGIAHMTGDVSLTLELAKKMPDRNERRLIEGLALMGRGDSRAEAEAAFREVLTSDDAAGRVDQKTRALMGLAGVGGFTDADVVYLDGLDDEIRDLIRAQSAFAAGRGAEAQSLMRRYPNSEPAAVFAAGHLRSKGEASEAVKVLETYATNRGDDRILLQAAFTANVEGLFGDADRLATRVAGCKNPGLRRAARQLIVDLAQQRLDWDRVLTETRVLLAERDRDLPEDEWRETSTRYRWARVNALAQKRLAPDAYMEIYRDPPLEIDTPDMALLALAILRAIASEVHIGGGDALIEGRAISSLDVLHNASEIAQRFRDREDIVGAALIISFSMPSVDGEIVTEELIEARRLQQQFFGSFPESTIARSVPVPSDPGEFIKTIAEKLVSSSSALDKMQRDVYVGKVPLSVLAAASQRSYAQLLIQNAAGCYILAAPLKTISDAEVEAARAALGGRVVLDTSTLFFAERVLGEFGALASRFQALVFPAPLRDDILSARATLSLKAVGSVGWDPVAESPRMVVYNDDLTESWSREAKRLQAALRFCETVPDPLFDGDRHIRAWTSSIRLAKEMGLSLVADDAVLRRVAANEGVAAFGTLQLLQVLEADGLVSTGAVEEAFRRLRDVKAAELPLLHRLQEIAAEEDWQPEGYGGFLLTRPTTWSPPIKEGLETYMNLVRSIPNRTADISARWCSYAAFGMLLTVPPSLRPLSVGSLIAWTVLETRDPKVLGRSMERTRHLMREFAPDGNLLREVVRVLTDHLRSLVAREHLAPLMSQLLSELDDADRREAMRVFLSTPWPDRDQNQAR